MASAISANKAELLAIANSVASEKMIDKSIVIEAMEEAIQKSARNRYGAENDIRAKRDGKHKTDVSKMVGALIASRAAENNISSVVFDRGGHNYHGRIKALADAAREGGLGF